MLRIIAIVLVLLSSSAVAQQRVSVNDYGADNTGEFDNSWAFWKAHQEAGPGGIIECDPGVYLFEREWWIWNTGTKVLCHGATLKAAPGVGTVLTVIQSEPDSEVRLVRLHLAGIEGAGRSANCLRVMDANFSHFEVDYIAGCYRGILVNPYNTRAADNTFRSLLIEDNDIGILVLCGVEHAQHNRFRVNFAANNRLGMYVPEADPCASMTVFRGSMDFNGQDMIVNSPNNLVELAFASRDVEPLEVSPTTYLHIMDLYNMHTLSLGEATLHEGAPDPCPGFLC